MNKMKYFAHAHGNNFTYQCNGEILYIGILNHYYLNNLGNQRGNWINDTRCITVVRRDTQKCCTKHNQGKLREHALTYITGRESNTKISTQVIHSTCKVIWDASIDNTGHI